MAEVQYKSAMHRNPQVREAIAQQSCSAKIILPPTTTTTTHNHTAQNNAKRTRAFHKRKAIHPRSSKTGPPSRWAGFRFLPALGA